MKSCKQENLIPTFAKKLVDEFLRGELKYEP